MKDLISVSADPDGGCEDGDCEGGYQLSKVKWFVSSTMNSVRTQRIICSSGEVGVRRQE